MGAVCGGSERGGARQLLRGLSRPHQLAPLVLELLRVSGQPLPHSYALWLVLRRCITFSRHVVRGYIKEPGGVSTKACLSGPNETKTEELYWGRGREATGITLH